MGITASPRPVVLSGMHSAFTNVLQALAVFGTIALAARLLGPGWKGEFDIYLSSSALLFTLLGSSLATAVSYTIAAQVSAVRPLYPILMMVSIGTGIFAFAIATLARHSYWSSVLLPRQLGLFGTVCIGVTVSLMVAATAYKAVLTGNLNFIAANHGDLLKQLLTLTLLGSLGFAAIVLHGSRIRFLVIANMLGLLGAVVYFARKAARFRVDGPGTAGLPALLSFAAPAALGNTLQFLNHRMDVFLVNGYHGVVSVGLYQTAVLIAEGINLLPGAVQAVLVPTVSARSAQDPDIAKKIARANRVLFGFGVLLAIAVGIVSPVIIPLVFGQRFHASVLALELLLPGCAIFVITNVTAGYFSGIGKPQVNLWLTLTGLLLTVPLDLLLIPKYDFLGAAVASTASYVATSFAALIAFRRATAIPLLDMFLPQHDDFRYLWSAIKGTYARIPR